MYDYHTHTNFSDDCIATPDEMIQRAISLGFKEYAITDHYDPDYPTFEFEIDAPLYHAALLELEEKYKEHIRIVKGIEIGIQHGATAIKCEKEASSFPYDFIIGSFHCMHGDDLYLMDYEKYDPAKIFPIYYEYCLNCLDGFMNFNVLGHINVIDRYVNSIAYFQQPGVPYFASDNFNKGYKDSMEIIEAIFSKLIKNDKGIEINTSHIRYNLLPRTVPTKEILSLYKQLGGEILTIGSDSHLPVNIGDGFAEARELAKSVGFRYLSTFKERQVTFVPIE